MWLTQNYIIIFLFQNLSQYLGTTFGTVLHNIKFLCYFGRILRQYNLDHTLMVLKFVSNFRTLIILIIEIFRNGLWNNYGNCLFIHTFSVSNSTKDFGTNIFVSKFPSLSCWFLVVWYLFWDKITNSHKCYSYKLPFHSKIINIWVFPLK